MPKEYKNDKRYQKLKKNKSLNKFNSSSSHIELAHEESYLPVF